MKHERRSSTACTGHLPRTRSPGFVIWLSFATVGGCQPANPSSPGNRSGATGQCRVNTDCSGGDVCLDGACRRLCNQSSDCDNGQTCSDAGVCVATKLNPPVISAINGTGSLDGAEGHGSRHIQDRLRITGRNLAEARFVLEGTSPYRPEVELERCSGGTNTEVQVLLPQTVEDTDEYRLAAINEAGECSARFKVLQGEPGSLEASAADIVNNVNAETRNDSNLRLNGTLESADRTLPGGGVTTLAVRGSVTMPVNVRTRVNASAYPTTDNAIDAEASGIYLLVFDLVEHSVVTTDFSTSSFGDWPQTGFYSSSRSQVVPALEEVLKSLNPSHVVLLASAGTDISKFTNDGPLLDAIADLGGSKQFAQLQTGADFDTAQKQSYVLIGSPGLGAGNGMEQVAGAKRNQEAELITAAIDQNVMGFMNRAANARNAIDGSHVANDSLGRDDIDADAIGPSELADDAIAVSEPYSASGRNKTINIGSHDVCFLTRAGVDDDQGNNRPRCVVFLNDSGEWNLRARADRSGDSATCQARCLDW